MSTDRPTADFSEMRRQMLAHTGRPPTDAECAGLREDGRVGVAR